MMNPIANYSTWLHTLPPWSQPSVATFIPCVAGLAVLMIWHRVNLHRRGEGFTSSKRKPAQLIGAMVVCGALFFFRDKYPGVRQVLDWPDRTFPLWHRHGGAMMVGFLAAGLAARAVSALFAAVFLRGGRGGYSGGGFAVGVRPVSSVRSVWVEHSTRGE